MRRDKGLLMDWVCLEVTGRGTEIPPKPPPPEIPGCGLPRQRRVQLGDEGGEPGGRSGHYSSPIFFSMAWKLGWSRTGS